MTESCPAPLCLNVSNAYPDVRKGARARSVLLAALVIIIIIVCETYSIPHQFWQGRQSWGGNGAIWNVLTPRAIDQRHWGMCWPIVAVWGAWPSQVLGGASAGGFEGGWPMSGWLGFWWGRGAALSACF